MSDKAPAAERRAGITAITSGKGGVGKTFVSANLAAALTRQGERVLVLDADLGLANLDVVLNLFPKVTLHDVFTGRSGLEEAILPAPGGYSVLLAGSGMVEYSRLTPEVREQLQQVIREVAPRYDRVLLEAGQDVVKTAPNPVQGAQNFVDQLNTPDISWTALTVVVVIAVAAAAVGTRFLQRWARHSGSAESVSNQVK